MEQRGREAIAHSAIAPESISIARAADMRYVGQEHAVTVDLDNEIFERGDRDAIKKAFDAVHLQRYGTSAPGEPADLVSLRVTVSGIVGKPPRDRLPLAGEMPESSARRSMRKVCFSAKAGFVDTPIYLRDGLKAGNCIRGPALIEEHASTTVLMPDDALAIDAYGNLDIAVGGAK
jgi:N-methylhydantoinase A